MPKTIETAESDIGASYLVCVYTLGNYLLAFHRAGTMADYDALRQQVEADAGDFTAWSKLLAAV